MTQIKRFVSYFPCGFMLPLSPGPFQEYPNLFKDCLFRDHMFKDHLVKNHLFKDHLSRDHSFRDLVVPLTHSWIAKYINPTLHGCFFLSPALDYMSISWFFTRNSCPHRSTLLGSSPSC